MQPLQDLKNPPPHLIGGGDDDRRPAIDPPTKQTDADAHLGQVF